MMAVLVIELELFFVRFMLSSLQHEKDQTPKLEATISRFYVHAQSAFRGKKVRREKATLTQRVKAVAELV